MDDVAGGVRAHLGNGEVELAIKFAVERLNHDEIIVQSCRYRRAKAAFLQGLIKFNKFATIEVAVVRELLRITREK